MTKQLTIFEKFREPLHTPPPAPAGARSRKGGSATSKAAEKREQSSEGQCAHDRRVLLEALERFGEEGCGTAYLRTLVMCSMTQRMTEVRRALEKQGKTVEFTPAPKSSHGTYRLAPYKITKGNTER